MPKKKEEIIEEIEEVEEEETEEEVIEEEEPPVSEHTSELERIAANIQKEREEESGIEEESQEEEIEEEPEEVEEPDEKPDENKVVEESTVDPRLEETQRLLTEANETIRSLQEAKDPPEQGEPEPEPDTFTDEEAKEFAETLQYGEADEVAAVIKKIGSRRQPTQAPAPQPVNISAEVNFQLKKKEIEANFEKSPDDGGFSDLAGNPYLKQAVTDRVWKKIRKDGANGNDWETYRKAGEEVREEIQSLLKIDSQTEDPAMEEKKDKKRKIEVVKPVTKKTTSTTKEEKPETHQEAIAKMRKQRGQIY